MTFLVLLLLIVALGLLIFVIRIAADVQAIRRELLHDIRAALREQRTYERSGTAGPIPRVTHCDPGPHGKHLMDDVGKVIWHWRGGDWVAEVPKGVDAGLPPDFPGRFEGERAQR